MLRRAVGIVEEDEALGVPVGEEVLLGPEHDRPEARVRVEAAVLPAVDDGPRATVAGEREIGDGALVVDRADAHGALEALAGARGAVRGR